MTTAATVDAKTVQSLRLETGAGFMDCKRALQETKGDLEKAREFLRKKGLADAEKRSAKAAEEGRVASYVHHDGKKAALVEVRCQTDFVARNEAFQELLDDLCLHVVGSQPRAIAVRREEIPAEIIEKERAILLESEQVLKKPEAIRGKIVEGQVDKFIKERVLLEQPFVKNPDMTVDERVKAASAKLGENIQVARFIYMELGR